MIRKTVKMNMIKDVSDFIKEVSKLDCDVDIVKGRYIVDAKSIIGIFTINLAEPVDIVVHSDENESVNNFFNEIKDIIIKE